MNVLEYSRIRISRPIAGKSLVLLLALLASIFLRPAEAGWFAEERVGYASDGAPDYFTSRAVAVDWTGRMHAVWNQYGCCSIYYSYWDGNGWSYPDWIGDGYEAQVACDPSGNVHVVYRSDYAGRIAYRSRTENGWMSSVYLEEGGPNASPSITADVAGNLHVVWSGDKDGNPEIYYRKWNGVSWMPTVRLTEDSYASYSPAVAVHQSGRDLQTHHVHVAWTDYRDGLGSGVFYKRFDGLSWSPDSLVTDPQYPPGDLSLALDSAGRVHLAWTGYRDGYYQLFHRLWDSESATPPEQLTQELGDVLQPSLAQGPGGSIHLAFEDLRDGPSRLWYRDWSEYAWSPELAVPTGEGESRCPSVATDLDGRICVFYHGFRTPQYSTDAYVIRYLNIPPPDLQAVQPGHGARDDQTGLRLTGTGFFAPVTVRLQREGYSFIQAQITEVRPDEVRCAVDLTGAALGFWDVVLENADGAADSLMGAFEVRPAIVWTPDEQLTFNNGSSQSPAMARDALGRIHLVWSDQHADSAAALYYRRFEGGGWTEEKKLAFATDAYVPDIAVGPDGVLHLVWEDRSDYDPDVYYASGDGSAWSPREIISADPYSTDSYTPTVSVDTAGTVHVAWSDYKTYNSSLEIYYKRKTGGIWSAEERLTMDPNDSECPQIASDSLGATHLIYIDCREYPCGVYYRQSSGNVWGPEIRAPFDTSYYYDECALAVDGDGVAHLLANEGCRVDYVARGPAGWSPVSQVFSNCGYGGISIAVDGDGLLHAVLCGYGEMYYRNGDGYTWGLQTFIVNGYPREAELLGDDSGDMHLVWSDNRDGDWEIFYKRRGEPLQPPDLVDVSPDSVPAFGIRELTGTGSGFLSPCQFLLTREGEAPIEGSVLETQASLVRAGFDVTGARLGPWNAVLISGDGQADTLLDAVTITMNPWGDETRLTDSAGLSTLCSNAGRSMIVDASGTAHLVWQDDRSGNGKVYYRSGANGQWGPEMLLTDDPAGSFVPVICETSGGVRLVAWQDARDGNPEIYAAVLQADGLHDVTRLTVDTRPSVNPAIAEDGRGGAYLVWQDGRDGNWEIYGRRWTAGAWEGLERITSHASADFHPTVAADQAGNTYVAWQTDRYSYYQNIYYRKASGGVWGTETRATYQYRDSSEPSLSRIGSGVYLAYSVEYYSGPNIYMLRLDEYSYEEQITYSETAGKPMLTGDDADRIHLVWTDRRTGVEQVWYKVLDQGGWSTEYRMTASPTEATLPCIAAGPGDLLALVWRDSRDGDYEIYSLGTWERDPSAGVDGAAAGSLGIACSPNPFEENVTLEISLPREGEVTLDLFDHEGRLVRRLHRGALSAGIHRVVWDGRDEEARSARNGVYFYRLIAGRGERTGRVLRIR